MNQEKFGNFIKEIRKKNNLTQKQLAEKYNLTYQAVSKWEKGKNMPDTVLIKQMSVDFGISLEEMFDGELKENKNRKTNKTLILVCLLMLFSIIIIILLIYLKNSDSDFIFKTLSSNCKHFSISGNIAYNDKKSSIYITNIKYCGGNDTTEYDGIECILYESNNDIEKKISSCSYNEEKNITLEEFLQTVTLTVGDYKKICKEYSQNSLFLSINAKDNNGKITTYKVPLTVEQNCSN